MKIGFRHSVMLFDLLNFFGISGDPLCQSVALCAPGGDVMAFQVSGLSVWVAGGRLSLVCGEESGGRFLMENQNFPNVLWPFSYREGSSQTLPLNSWGELWCVWGRNAIRGSFWIWSPTG